ncbi:PaaI family thioesterase [Picrophilus oshimae]|uniref:Thioesterase superfamily protein n=1 Tax=Picrophilus torridus (strain ATCC 700027 / DSM 9790 / JCM 10055 / NBRC 100828 / KAW 2/3) TaxID=1122961 RepID=A0A8G2FX00_PICTO|nr:PaaI family thioesterase [Picrophilus oshimae]SMD31027.1 Thioesterase superfamily protein [Picrophilus oshimae DSM 9789]
MTRLDDFKNIYNNVDALNKLMEHDKLFNYMNIRFTRVSRGHVELEFPISENVVRVGNVLHGGMIMTAMDYTGGFTCMTVASGMDQVTQEIKINFLAPMAKSPFKFIGDIIKEGRTAIVVEIRAYDSEKKLCAIGLGTWYVLHDRTIGH